MPDLLDQLEQEHREVEQLLDELESAEEPDERRALLGTLESALVRHMAVEEQLVYPRVRELDEEMSEEAEVEHEGARELLGKLAPMAGRPGFGAMVAALKGAIAHHVEEEEDEVFPLLRRELEGAELERMTTAAEQAKVGSAEVRGGRGGPDTERSREELYERAKALDIGGRSSMSKEELAEAVRAAEGG